MKTLRWQFLVVVLALAAIGALLLTQRQVFTPGEQTGDQPVVGGVYTEALVGQFGRLNPVLDYYNQSDYDIDHLIFSGLVRFNDRGLPSGDLADSWGVSQDGKVYNFSIRPNASWHDGQPVTTDDILYTVGLLQDENIPLPADLREFWAQVQVVALDEKIVQFILPEPFAPFLDYLTFGVLPAHLLDGTPPEQITDASFNLNPIGSGPFRFLGLDVENNQVVGVKLKAFAGYYGEKPFIDQLVFRYYVDSAAALFAYKEGKVMGISNLRQDVLPEALKERNLRVFTGRLPRLNLVYLNLNDPAVPFFQDPVVRRALLMGINRTWIIDHLMGGQALTAHSPIFPDSWAYYDGVQQTPFDSDAALALLKEAGYTIPASGGVVRADKDGVLLFFNLLYPDDPLSTAIAQRIQTDWARLGVEASIQAVGYDQLVTDFLATHKYQAVLAELNLSRSPDPDPYPFWHQAQINGGQNYSGWDDRQVSEFLEQGRVEVDLAERTRRYRNFQVRFGQELPALPLFYPVYSFGIDAQVRGVSMGPLYDPSDRFNGILNWYLATGAPTPIP